MGVRGAAMFCETQAGCTENLPSWCASFTPSNAPLETAPFAAAPRLAGNAPATGMSSQRAPQGDGAADEPAGAPAASDGTVMRSCHIAGDCGANVAAPPVSDVDANSGVA